MKQLLIETFPIKVESSILLESARKNDGRLIVGNMKIQQADEPNKNKRVYGRSIIEREMTKLIESVRRAGSRGVIGELDHPSTGQQSDSIVSLKNACLGILDWRWRGNDLLGDVEVFKDMTSDKTGYGTPSGEILGNLILSGYIPGISSRGMGSIESMGGSSDPDIVEVQDDFELITYDGVSDPSSQNAYFTSIRESVNRTSNYKYSKANQLIRDIICEIGGVCECQFKGK